MKKIVINACYGGFGLSEKAVELYFDLKSWALYKKVDYSIVHYYRKPEMTDDNYWYERDLPRDDTILVKVVEQLGSEANGDCVNLKIVEIPDYIDWQIDEYDGVEWVAGKHETWG